MRLLLSQTFAAQRSGDRLHAYYTAQLIRLFVLSYLVAEGAHNHPTSIDEPPSPGHAVGQRSLLSLTHRTMMGGAGPRKINRAGFEAASHGRGRANVSISTGAGNRTARAQPPGAQPRPYVRQPRPTQQQPLLVVSSAGSQGLGLPGSGSMSSSAATGRPCWITAIGRDGLGHQARVPATLG